MRATVLMMVVLSALIGDRLYAKTEPLRLSLPLDCILHETCFLQNFVDIDPSKEVQDFRCRKSAYDGHKGVDFRIRSIAETKAGVPVLAVADGQVEGVRDGMQDRRFQKGDRAHRQQIKGRECGNGVRISHGDGWETQYCHMRKGSIGVRRGERVRRGQQIGLIGLSGKTAFPHIHLGVRHKGKIVDPFYGERAAGVKCGAQPNSLWRAGLFQSPVDTDAAPFLTGFSDRPVDADALMQNGKVMASKTRRMNALVFYGQAINLQKGDRLRLQIKGPKGEIIDHLTEPMPRHKAQYLAFAGKKRKGDLWPAGLYTGAFSLVRAKRTMWTKHQTLTLD